MAKPSHPEDSIYWLPKDDVLTFLTTNPKDIVCSTKTFLYMVVIHSDDSLTISRYEGGLGSRWHAEHQALYQVKNELRMNSQETPCGRVIFILNYSPCETCADEIIQFCDQFENVQFKIMFSGVTPENFEALQKMRFHGFQRIEIECIRKYHWTRLMMWQKGSMDKWWDNISDVAFSSEEPISQITKETGSQDHNALMKRVLTDRNFQDTMLEEIMGDQLYFPIPCIGDRFIAIRSEADQKMHDICSGKPNTAW